MAMGLGFLGRESRARSTSVGLLHVLSSGAGGALTGSVLGAMGAALGVEGSGRPWVVGVAGAIAFAVALRPDPMNLGRPCQVPQRWTKTMPVGRLYTAWGLMLGSAVATLIPYSAQLLLLGGQFASGPAAGAIAGAIYGAARESTALAGVSGRLEPGPAMSVLERWARPARLLNIAIVTAGGAALVATTV